MTVFLTGATGFLGSVLARTLLSEGFGVRAIHRKRSAFDLLDDIKGEIEWIEGDVLDPESLEQGMIGVDGVFHCAAFLGFEGKRSEKQLMDVNVTGTANVVDAVLTQGVSRLLHVSSVAALGRSEDENKCQDESAVWQNSTLNTGYAISKHRAEMEVHRGIAQGLEAVMVNPSLIMGAGRKGENTMQIADKLIAGRLPVLPGGATNVVDVKDVAEGALKAYHRGRVGHRYLLTGHNMLWKEIIGTIASTLGAKAPTRQVSTGMMVVIAAFFELAARISGTNPLLTRETARLSAAISCYDNTKAREELECSFRSFESTAASIASVYGLE